MKHLALAMLCTLPLVLAACEASKPANGNRVTPEDVKKDATKALETTRTYLAQQAVELRKRLNAKLTEVGPLVADAKARAQTASGNAKVELDQLSNDLDAKVNQARDQVGELEKAGSDASDEVKARAEKALDAVNEAYAKLKQKLDGA